MGNGIVRRQTTVVTLVWEVYAHLVKTQEVGKMEEGKSTLEVQTLACPRQELSEPQNSSRRSRIPKLIQGQLVGSNEQEVWFGTLRRLGSLERESSRPED